MRFGALDSWRGIAALLVAGLHVRFLGHYYDVPFVRGSWLFVDFFFVLSGFVITHAYGQRLVDGYDSFSFTIRRFGRLWPLHFAVLLAFLLAEILKWIFAYAGVLTPDSAPFDPSEKYSIATFVSNVFLLQSLGLHDKLSWNEPSWSISTEFYTYLVFALFCHLRRRTSQTVMASLLAAGSLGVVMWRSSGSMNTTFDYGFFRCVCGFFVGHLCYRLYEACRERATKPSTLAEIAAAMVTVLFVSIAGANKLSLAAPFVFALVVWVFAFEGGALSRLLRAKPFQRLGDWSYSIYMVHTLLVMAISRCVSVAEKATGDSLRIYYEYEAGAYSIELISFGNEYLMDAFALLYLVLVLATAAATYRFIEVPCRAYFNGIAKRRDDRLKLSTGNPPVQPDLGQ